MLRPKDTMTFRPHTVVSVRVAQLETLADVLARAFHDEPNFTYMVADNEKRPEVLPWFFATTIRAGRRYGEVHTTESTDGGAVWLAPGKRLTFWSMLRTGLIGMPFKLGWADFRRAMTLNVDLDQARAELARRPHWYLMALGVAPERQGRGIGGALIGPVLERADSEGLPCYLETFNERNLRFYEKRGFRVSSDGRIPEGGPFYWTMLRKA